MEQQVSQHKHSRIPNRKGKREKGRKKYLKKQWQRFPVGEHIYILGGWHIQFHGDRISCAQDPSRPCPVYFFIWVFIYILYSILYNKPVNKNLDTKQWSDLSATNK